MTLLNTIQNISGINHHQAVGLTDHNWGHRPQLCGGIVPSYAGHSPRSPQANRLTQDMIINRI